MGTYHSEGGCNWFPSRWRWLVGRGIRQASEKKITKGARGNLVLQPIASASNHKDPTHFKLITKKEVIQYTLLGNVDKVFELTGIRTTATHLKRVHKEIADRIELKRILDMHNHDQLIQKIRVRSREGVAVGTAIQRDRSLVAGLQEEGISDAANRSMIAERIVEEFHGDSHPMELTEEELAPQPTPQQVAVTDIDEEAIEEARREKARLRQRKRRAAMSDEAKETEKKNRRERRSNTKK